MEWYWAVAVIATAMRVRQDRTASLIRMALFSTTPTRPGPQPAGSDYGGNALVDAPPNRAEGTRGYL